MIDHQYRCIFIHQRKVAGQSIMAAFGKKPATPEWDRFNAGAIGREWERRSQAETAYLVFSAVRNPFDRLVSSWKYLPACRERPLGEILENPPLAGHDYRHLTRPQLEILQDATSGRLITDELIRFETLQTDFDRICDRLAKPRSTLPKLNGSERTRDYRRYYTKESRSLAERLFTVDLNFFGYEF